MLKPTSAPAGGRTAPVASRRPPRPAGPPGSTIALVQSSSLPTLVLHEVERMILTGDLPAGAKLNEADIAGRLGVSRGPVREAFRGLEAAGLVRLEKNRGVFVREPSVEEADQIFELRAVLDEFVGRRAAEVATADQVRDLKGLIADMERAATRGDVDGYHAHNVAFHERLVALAGNAKLSELYRRLVNELNLFRRASFELSGILPQSLREHRAIVERIAARQGAAAGRLCFEHVIQSRSRMHEARRHEAPAAKPQRAARGGRRT